MVRRRLIRIELEGAFELSLCVRPIPVGLELQKPQGHVRIRERVVDIERRERGISRFRDHVLRGVGAVTAGAEQRICIGQT